VESPAATDKVDADTSPDPLKNLVLPLKGRRNGTFLRKSNLRVHGVLLCVLAHRRVAEIAL
jgi:hypothetical protein